MVMKLRQTFADVSNLLRPVVELATVTVEERQDGEWWTLLDAVPCQYTQAKDQLKRGDEVDSAIFIRASVFDGAAVPHVHRLCRVFVTHRGGQQGPFTPVLWVPDDPLELAWRMELDEQGREQYG